MEMLIDKTYSFAKWRGLLKIDKTPKKRKLHDAAGMQNKQGRQNFHDQPFQIS
jgi:hypothetical protein